MDRKTFRFFKIAVYSIEQLLKKDFFYVVLLLTSAVVNGIIPILNLWLVTIGINCIVDEQRLDKAIFSVIFISLGVVLLKCLDVFVLWNRSNHYVELGHKFDVLNARKIIDLEYERLQDKETLDLTIRAAKGCSAVARIGEAVSDIIAYIFQMVGTVSIMINFCGIYTAVIVGISFLCYYFGRFISNKIYENERESAGSDRSIDYYLDVMLDSRVGKELRLYQAFDLFEKKYTESEEERYSFSKKNSLLQLTGKLFNMFFLTIQMVLVYLLADIKFVKGHIAVGELTLCIGTVTVFSNSFTGMFSSINNVFLLEKKINDFKEFQELDIEADNSLAVEDSDNLEIKFENVGYKYPGASDFAIRNVNFKIRKGEKIAIIGENGAGKSTFIKLLLRLYRPSEGKILVNGKDYLLYGRRELYSLFSSVFQDFNLMAYTLRENIVCKEKMMAEEVGRLEEAIEKWGLSSFVDNLKNGYNTYISRKYDEQGVDFSGGERQKIAIARAFYRNKQVIILDEPTSAIDPIAEERLYGKMLELMENKTVVLISHRLSSTRLCDKIAFFSNNTISETGTHEQLMEKKGGYYKMYQSQSKWYV